MAQPTPVLAAPELDRRTVLRAAGLTGLALSAAAPAAAGEPTRRLSPFDLDFRVVAQKRQLDLVGNRFVQLTDSFDGPPVPYDHLSPTGRPGTATLGGGRLSLSGTGTTGFSSLFRSATKQVAPFAAVVVDVAAFSGATTQDAVLCGLVKDAGSYVVAFYDRATRTAGIEVAVNGTVSTLGTVSVDIQAPFQLSFGLTSSTVVALADTGSGPRPLLRKTLDGLLDLRQPQALEEYRNGFGARASSGTVVLEKVEAGYFGELGLRDPHLVTRADGTPYIKDGKAYLTFTQAGLAFFETAHWGVWTLDTRTFELEQVANLFFQRDGNATVLGDHAGHIVLDDRNDRWIVANSTWGDFTGKVVQINYTTLPLKQSPLRGVHVLKTERLDLPLGKLPSAAVGQWDPHIVKIGRRWYVGFVNAREFFNFYPALARSRPGDDFTKLQLAGADPSKKETEGTVLQRFGGRWYVMASNGDASPERIRDQYPVYDLEMKQLGRLDAPHPTNIPWPMVFPVTKRGRTSWLLVTFNGTQYHEDVLGYGTHGDLVVMRAKQVTRGPEF